MDLPQPLPSPAPAVSASRATWLPTTNDGYREMLAAIGSATASIRFEIYIFKSGGPGDRFRDALIAAARRGVEVRVLLDGFGSAELVAGYWDGLVAAGGQAVLFNPGPLLRLPIRDHHKLVVVDQAIAFIGGFNIGPEYEGDGVSAGWRDLGLAIAGPAAATLAASFDAMWENRNLRRHRALRNLAAQWRHRRRQPAALQLMSMGPALGRNAFQELLLREVRHAREIRLIAAYFVPSLRLRRALRAVARRGGRVQIILPGKSDVPLVQAAGRSYYSRLLGAGVEIAEYTPQILHAKLAVIDDVVFAGSSNLDARSLRVNYEVMARVADPALAAEGRRIFEADWGRSRVIRLAEWRAQRGWTDRLYGLVARFCLVKIDLWFARNRLRALG